MGYKFGVECPCAFCNVSEAIHQMVASEIEKNVREVGVTGNVHEAADRFALTATVYIGKIMHDLINDLSAAGILLVAANREKDRDVLQERIANEVFNKWDEKTGIVVSKAMSDIGILDSYENNDEMQLN